MTLARRARRIIGQNLVVAGAVIAILLPAAVFGLANIAATVSIHEGSPLVVVANALRLLTWLQRPLWFEWFGSRCGRCASCEGCRGAFVNLPIIRVNP